MSCSALVAVRGNNEIRNNSRLSMHDIFLSSARNNNNNNRMMYAVHTQCIGIILEKQRLRRVFCYNIAMSSSLTDRPKLVTYIWYDIVDCKKRLLAIRSSAGPKNMIMYIGADSFNVETIQSGLSSAEKKSSVYLSIYPSVSEWVSGDGLTLLANLPKLTVARICPQQRPLEREKHYLA